jgi:hypothetical protein
MAKKLPSPELVAGIDALIAHCDQIMVDHYKEQGFSHSSPPIHNADYMSAKWCRIWAYEMRNGTLTRSRSHAFVCLQDGETKFLGKVKAGDIHKCATWKAPSKHARGNVLTRDFTKMGPYGPAYL